MEDTSQEEIKEWEVTESVGLEEVKMGGNNGKIFCLYEWPAVTSWASYFFCLYQCLHLYDIGNTCAYFLESLVKLNKIIYKRLGIMLAPIFYTHKNQEKFGVLYISSISVV